MLCTRCIDMSDLTNANFCPRCGRNLKWIPAHTPTIAELRTFEAQLSDFLPRLREMRMRLDQSLSEATERGHDAALDLTRKRRLLVAQVERRLEEHLRAARRQLFVLDMK
jgi:hypothetical protein